MANLRKDSIAAAVRDIANSTQTDGGRDSIFQVENPGDITDTPAGTTTGGVRQKLSAVGTGLPASGAAFTNIPNAVFPANIYAAPLLGTGHGTPTPPRNGSAVGKYISGITNDTMAIYLSWSPPLVDTAGRWLQSYITDSGTGKTVVTDLIDTYLITRETIGLGEFITVGVVAHNEQYITEIQGLLTAANLVTTDPRVKIATFAASIMPSGVLTIPLIDERFFTFVDTSAQYGKTYRYYVEAITQAQVESDTLLITPGAATGEGTLDIQFGTTWCSSFPDLTSPNGEQSFADFAVIAAGITDSCEIGLVPIQSNALAVNTAPDPSTVPFVIGTTPTEVKIWIPATGTLQQIIEFRGHNMEIAGGITGIVFRSGVTLNTPVSSNIVKTRVGSTDDWDYQAKITVASTATAGPMSMTVTCLSGQTAISTAATGVAVTTTSTEGAAFTPPTIFYDTETTCDVVIIGTNLNRIKNIEIHRSTGVLLGNATILMQSANYLEFTYALPSTGIFKLVSTYDAPFVATGNDTGTLTIRTSRDPNGDNGTKNTYTSKGVLYDDARMN